MAKEVTALTQTQRGEMIRKYADEVKFLNKKRDEVLQNMRALSREVRKNLNMDNADFGLAIRMYGAAFKNKEKTIATIREVMAALGGGDVVIEAPKQQEIKKLPFGEASLGAKVLEFVSVKGEVKAKEVGEQFGASGVAYLSHLKRWGYVENKGCGVWKAAQQ